MRGRQVNESFYLKSWKDGGAKRGAKERAVCEPGIASANEGSRRRKISGDWCERCIVAGVRGLGRGNEKIFKRTELLLVARSLREKRVKAFSL